MGLPREMAENERSVFALHGATGMLIATALLLSILFFLVSGAVATQQAEATNVYKIENAHELKMIDENNKLQYKLVNE
jgi:uncharacterized protein YlxW (UPF0749 family)